MNQYITKQRGIIYIYNFSNDTNYILLYSPLSECFLTVLVETSLQTLALYPGVETGTNYALVCSNSLSIHQPKSCQKAYEVFQCVLQIVG